jgi:hypothetical protein
MGASVPLLSVSAPSLIITDTQIFIVIDRENDTPVFLCPYCTATKSIYLISVINRWFLLTLSHGRAAPEVVGHG